MDQQHIFATTFHYDGKTNAIGDNRELKELIIQNIYCNIHYDSLL